MASTSELTMSLASLLKRATDFPLPSNLQQRYGTAGFRGAAANFGPIAFRSGIVVALRCYQKQGDCGLVITASHNPVEDNGVKFVDFNGEMFPKEWEQFAERVVNAESPEDLVGVVQQICQEEKIQLHQRIDDPLKVFAGHDSRPSSPQLLEAAKAGLEALQIGVAFESGPQTTPQIHYRVWRRHQKAACGEFQWVKYMSGGFMRMARGTYGRHGVLTVDCANGVAASKLERLGNCPGAVPQGYRFQLKNTGDGTLNAKCGSEYVQKHKALPINFDAIDDWQRCASVDGDVDRAVYFTKANSKTIVFDGDRICALCASHIRSLLDKKPSYKSNYTFGVILTAYSNQALIKFLRDQDIDVKIVRTGVKNLYKAAREFDIGMFYEPNGHGSIVFSSNISENLRKMDVDETEDPVTFALLALSDVMNQTVGDAVSNILTIEAILRVREWSLEQWLELYEPFPSKTADVEVTNKADLKTDDNETKCIHPPKLQEDIDKILSTFPNSRAFVRPSGTEEIVRIHVEAETDAAVDQITQKLSQCVSAAFKK